MQVDHITGLTLAVVAMVLYGVYMVPRKKSRISQSSYTFWMGLGALLCAGLLGLVFRGIVLVTHFQLALMLISGVVWATGTHAYCRGVQLIGLARSTPIKNTSAMLGTIFGILILHEFSFHKVFPLVLVMLGSAAIVVSATILGLVEANGDGDLKITSSRAIPYGIACSVWAAISYSVYTIPMKILFGQGVGPSTFLFYMSVGCFVGMSLTALVTRPRKDSIPVTWRDRNLAMLSGAMWAVGSMGANIAVKLIGVAITWPLTKTTLVAVLYGVLVLREIDVARHKRTLTNGLVLSLIGVALLAWATAVH
ncbi:MAG: GRP family sugar transporter [Armatimonadota bacterium]|nr:GRP family sugar transporter [bacterium]